MIETNVMVDYSRICASFELVTLINSSNVTFNAFAIQTLLYSLVVTFTSYQQRHMSKTGLRVRKLTLRFRR